MSFCDLNLSSQTILLKDVLVLVVFVKLNDLHVISPGFYVFVMKFSFLFISVFEVSF